MDDLSRCIAAQASDVPRCSPCLFWFDLGGTRMKRSTRLNQHAAARSRIHSSSASGSSRTFRQRGDASLIVLGVLASVQQNVLLIVGKRLLASERPSFLGISL